MSDMIHDEIDEITESEPYVPTNRRNGFAIPHHATFASIYSSWTKTYLQDQSDEARRHRRESALAMYRDTWLLGLLDERVDSLLCRDWQITSDDPKDPVQASVNAGLATIIEKIPNLNQILKTTWRNALWTGRSGISADWRWDVKNLPVPGYPSQRKMYRALTVGDTRPVNGDKINFTWEGVPTLQMQPSEIEKLPGAQSVITNVGHALLLSGSYRERMLIVKHDLEDADYWEGDRSGAVNGQGIRSRIYWPMMMRRNFLDWILDSLERVGLGIVVIRYEMGNAEAKREAEKIARNMSRRSTITVPVSADGRLNTAGVEIVNAPTDGVVMIQGLIAWIEGQVERYIVGQHMSAGQQQSGNTVGSSKWAAFAEDTKLQKIESDADEFSAWLTGSRNNPGLVSILKHYNYPWASYFDCRMTWNTDEEDPAEQINAAQGMLNMGLGLKADEVRQRGGAWSKPEPGDEAIGGMMAAPPQLGMSSSDNAPAMGQQQGQGTGQAEADVTPEEMYA